MRTLFLFCLLFSTIALTAQTSGDNKTTVVQVSGDTTGSKDTADKVLTFVEIMPVFPGGQAAFTEYLQKNIKYPKKEKKAGKEGTVYVKFIVMKDGSIDSVHVVKGVEGAPGLSEEAIRVVKAMPKWTPGTMNGRPVRVEITLPLKFTLSKD